MGECLLASLLLLRFRHLPRPMFCVILSAYLSLLFVIPRSVIVFFNGPHLLLPCRADLCTLTCINMVLLCFVV